MTDSIVGSATGSDALRGGAIGTDAISVNMCYPSDIANLVLWVKADAGVYTDAGKTTLAIDNDLVYTWDDQSTANKDFVQATASLRPTYKTSIVNSLPVIRFDGIDNVMKSFNTASVPKTSFIIARKRSTPSTTASGLMSNGNVLQLMTDTDYGTGWEYYQSVGGDQVGEFGGNPEKWSIVCVKYTDLSHATPYINGVAGVEFDPGDTYSNITDLWIGGLNDTPAGPGDFDIAEVIIFNQTLEDGDRVNIENYLLNKYGIVFGSGVISVWTRMDTVLEATEAFEEDSTFEPCLIYEGSPQILIGETNVFKLWYTAGWVDESVNYAESADGINFTKYTSNPVIGGNHCRPSVLKSGATYYMFTVAWSDPFCVDLYTSADGITWALDTAAVLSKGAPGAWDDEGIANTSVWIEGVGDWRMLYDASGGSGWHTGYATSPDGITWTKYIGNPIMDGGEMGTGPSNVHKVGANYWVWTHGYPESNLPTDGYRFRSTDCMTWVQDPIQIILERLTADEGVGTAIGQIADLQILEVGGKTYLYYTASADGAHVTGLMHTKLAIADMTIAQLVLTDERL